VSAGSLTAAFACALLAAACGGGGGGGGGATPGLECQGTVAGASDLVRFDCPASSGSPMAVRVMIGPTTMSDIYGIKFDVVFDPAVVTFDPPAIEGDFLDQDGSGTAMEAGTQPGDPGRLVVSVTRVGAVGGVGVTGAEKTVITLPFMGVASGTTALAFENAQAVDPSLTPIAGLQFGGPVDLTSP
jgi:hypothetical protein